MTVGKPSLLLELEDIGLEAELGRIGEVIPLSCIVDPAAFARSGTGRALRAVVVSGGESLAEWIWSLPSLGLIACAGAGFDGIDLDRARRAGVMVTAGRGVNDADVADMAVGLTLSLVRQINRGDRLVRAGQWTEFPPLPCARSLSRMRCGIVGLGAIGTAIAERLDAFGCTIAWWAPRPQPGVAWPRAESLGALARDSDLLILAAPSTPESRGAVDAGILKALGPRGYLVNVARGNLVDETALLTALRERRIAGAGLDVFSNEPDDGARWSGFDNVVLTPHLGGWADRAMADAIHLCAANVTAFFAGTAPPTIVQHGGNPS